MNGRWLASKPVPGTTLVRRAARLVADIPPPPIEARAAVSQTHETVR